MKKDHWQSRIKDDLIVEVWEHLDCPSVGAAVLKEIQSALDDNFGPGRADSPAGIARTLVDAGADLHHPEVLEYDASWREGESQKPAAEEHGVLFDLENGWDLGTAATWIEQLEKLRRESEQRDDPEAVKQLEAQAREQKRSAQTLAASAGLSSNQRLSAGEIAEWLTIWLQTPQLFQAWLDLRRQSPEFLGKFSG
ncbi:MAG: hypothetical protein QOD75_232 [Blastocatellia bacterium]|jgi:hypothetical protein|nr:hypothetical protein [Blastocatellia bacterium]